jgi:methylglyoxal/glyoxal reductase
MVSLFFRNFYINLLNSFLLLGNEEAVGKAIRESNVPREEIFVTTKYKQWLNEETVAENFKMSLEKLGLGYIDLWLMHWPMVMKNGKPDAVLSHYQL